MTGSIMSSEIQKIITICDNNFYNFYRLNEENCSHQTPPKIEVIISVIVKNCFCYCKYAALENGSATLVNGGAALENGGATLENGGATL